MSEILFADVDAASVEDAVLTAYEKISGATLYPGDPVRLFLESLAYTVALQNNVINLAGRQNLLAYATGEHLDYIGMMVGTPRLGDSPAVAVQRFFVNEPLAFDVAVPAGTRVTTSDGRAMFATDTEAVIVAGEEYVDVAVTATVAGAACNGLVAGQINQCIDPVAYISKTANTTVTLLGSDIEDDTRYRARIQEAPEAFSCAGPRGAYRAKALAAHQDIAEVAVWCPKPGTVDVRPVMTGGELPTEETLEKVRTALSAEDVRPLTDSVTVQAPELVEYDINITWYLPKNMQALVATVTARVNAAVEQYRLWQRVMPGRDILPLKLQSLMEQAGARRLELPSPVYTPLAGYQLARERTISVTYGGVEE